MRKIWLGIFIFLIILTFFLGEGGLLGKDIYLGNVSFNRFLQLPSWMVSKTVFSGQRQYTSSVLPSGYEMDPRIETLYNMVPVLDVLYLGILAGILAFTTHKIMDKKGGKIG